MTVQIYNFPGVDDSPLPDDHPATFEEYLASAGLASSTIVGYTRWAKRAVEESEQMGSALGRADSEMLEAIAAKLTAPDSTGRNNLAATLSHWFRWQGADNPPHWVEWSPTNLDVSVAWERSATYEAYLLSVGISENTIRAYAWHVNRAAELCQQMGGDLVTATPQMLAAVAEEIGATHSMRAQLRSGLKHYYRWRDRRDAPLSAVRVPPAPPLVCQALEPAETRSLIETARGWWPKGGAVLLGLFLALRRFEIAKAEWSRFDDEMMWYRVVGKRDKTATLPVHPVIREEFASRRGDGFVFPGRTGVREHVSPATIWAWTSEVAEMAGLGHVRTHQLRHTSLTTALDNTKDLRSVMEFARHTKPQTTASYTRTTAEQLRAVSDALKF